MTKRRALALFFFAAFLIQGIFLIQRTSPTTDEVAFQMVNGYTYLKTHDYRMSPANPAFLREWMALPWLFLRPKLDLTKKSWSSADSVPFAQEVFYKDNRAIADRLLYSSRFMALLFGLGIGVFIFIWARSLYGDSGGLLGLGLYSFCPNFLAHSSIAMTDVGTAFFALAAAYFFWGTLEKKRRRDFWFFLIALGFAFASKYHSLFYGPLFLGILWARRGFKEFLKGAFFLSVVSFLIIWTTYFFEWKPLLAGGVPRVEEKLKDIAAIAQFLFHGGEGVKAFLQNAALHFPIPIPSYLLGLAGILKGHSSGYLHYAFGQWTTQGCWYHYLFVFFIKMTLPFLFLFAVRAIFIKQCRVGSKTTELILLLPVAVWFVITSFDTTGVGVRYLLLVIPLLFVWVAGVVSLSSIFKSWKWVLGVALVSQMVTALTAFPNYLSYFNPLVGGAKGGYRYVRGSDVDWGQGLKGLKKYMHKNGLEKITLEYFGTADPSFYGIDYELWTTAERQRPLNKIYAVSLYYLEHAQWSKTLKPTAMVDGCIFIYDFRRGVPE